MAYNNGREDRKWRIWKEAEEKVLSYFTNKENSSENKLNGGFVQQISHSFKYSIHSCERKSPFPDSFLTTFFFCNTFLITLSGTSSSCSPGICVIVNTYPCLLLITGLPSASKRSNVN